MYELVFTKAFSKALKKLLKKHVLVGKQVDKILLTLSRDPYNISLRTHTVITRIYGKTKSSRLTDDLRIVWDFSNEEAKIELYDIGGHSGGWKVYK